MTTYTTITNAEIDQDSPITQPLLTALRDNPLAIAEGDPTGPGLSVLGFEPLTAGNTTRYSHSPTSGSVSSGSTSTVMQRILIQKGTIRIKFNYKYNTFGGGSTAAYNIELDGVSVASGTTTSTSYVSIEEDITLTGGNRLSLIFDATSGQVDWQNPVLATGGAKIFPILTALGGGDFENYDFS